MTELYNHPYIAGSETNKEAGILDFLRRTAVQPLPAPKVMPSYKDILMRKVLPVTGMATAAVGVPMAVVGGVQGIKSLVDNHRLNQSYEEMFERNPVLAEYRDMGKEDAVRDRFEVLKTFAPDVARNSLVAASAVAGLLEQGDNVHPLNIDQLVGIQGKIRQGTGNAPWLLGGTTSIMSGLNKVLPADFMG